MQWMLTEMIYNKLKLLLVNIVLKKVHFAVRCL